MRGKAHHRRGELAAAERLLRQAIAADAAVPEYHGDLANVLQDRGELDGAIAAYRRALRLKPDAAEALNDLGTAYAERAKYEAAIDCYRAAIRAQPEHIVAHGNLGAAYRKLGRIRDARRALQRELVLRLKHAMRTVLPRRARAPAAQAEEALRRGNARLAEEIARSVLAGDGKDVAALRVLAQALEQQDRANEAIATLREAVRLAPRDATLHARAGRLLVRTGELDAALGSLEQSRALDPRSPGALAALAELELKKGNPQRAEAFAREALSLQPDSVALCFLVGEALMKQRAFDAAQAQYRRAIELDPSHLSSWLRSSELARESGRVDEALAYATRALEIDPESAPALLALGLAFRAKGRNKDAIECFRRSLANDSQYVQAHQQLGRVLREEDDIAGSERELRAALKLRPDDASLLADLALALGDQMRYDEAFAALERALARSPESIGALTCKGLLLDQTGRGAEAFACLEKALALAPQDDNSHFTIGLHHLKYHRFGPGWDGYEHRRRLINFVGRYRQFPFPEWDGSPLDGRTLLVYPEQGLGDEIMFSSCIPELAARARHVVLECDRKLEQIFRRSFPAATVVPRHRSVANDWVTQLEPKPDVQTPLGTLPGHFRRGLEDFPDHRGYLRADAQKVEAWRTRIAALGPGRAVGLSWQGGVGYTGRTRRSLSLEQLLPLLRLPGVHFVSLQYTNVREELESFERRHGRRVHHWPEALEDYDETAALVCAVDEVLTVCTAIVHLTGALGRPGTVMVPFGADWRYGGEGERMPWYPSLRLVRQRALGDWSGVLQEVERRLAGAQ